MAAPLGNTNAVKSKPWQGALKRALARAGAGEIDTGLNAIAEKVVEAAMDGDRDAWREIAERLDGKTPQAIIGGDDGDPPVAHSLAVEFLNARR